jgi:hypothetical protein
MQTRIQTARPARHDSTAQDGLDDAAAALLIRTGYVFDAILVLVGLIAALAGHVAGGLAVAGLGVAALTAGWLVVELSDHFHR